MSIYDVRKLGREYCQTDGSAHYKGGGVEPLDLMISKGIIEDFCIGNMVKYATRFKHTRNLEDLKKVSDYSHILAGVELEKVQPKLEIIPDEMCSSCNKQNFSNLSYCNLALSKTKECKENNFCYWEVGNEL